jgi:hypothetical protein
MAMTDILVKAAACDIVRVATLQYTFIQCFMNVDGILPHMKVTTKVNNDIHELAHLLGVPGGGRNGQKIFMSAWGWHMLQFARLVDGLRAERGADGKPLLDNSVITFVNEGGFGPGPKGDKSSHSTHNMMMVVAGGRNLGLKPGNHILGMKKHPANVFVSAMKAVGVQTEKFGQVTGSLPLG